MSPKVTFCFGFTYQCFKAMDRNEVLQKSFELEKKPYSPHAVKLAHGLLIGIVLTCIKQKQNITMCHFLYLTSKDFYLKYCLDALCVIDVGVILVAVV